ncbi:hypothetical protein HanRHA438_Chr12g0553541 [Helianthus annuus]|nr:hypothetical protein HanRHA438_Chr12g0553541 [Helianthus annuus]
MAAVIFSPLTDKEHSTKFSNQTHLSLPVRSPETVNPATAPPFTPHNPLPVVACDGATQRNEERETEDKDGAGVGAWQRRRRRRRLRSVGGGLCLG